MSHYSDSKRKTLNLTPAAVVAAAHSDIANFLVAATPGGIERQEAEGQKAVTSNFTQLPVDGMNRYADVLTRLGFKIGDWQNAKDIFVDVVAPLGWALRPTSHSMHNDIVDAQGRVRGNMFYKAAFYDRRANFHLRTRYALEDDYDTPADRKSDDWRSRSCVIDRATGARIEELPWRNYDDYVQSDKDRTILLARLAELFPDHENVEAYWENV